MKEKESEEIELLTPDTQKVQLNESGDNNALSPSEGTLHPFTLLKF